MIERAYYLEKLKPFLGKPVIKAVTGMRRVGKSVFVRQIIDYLKAHGIDEGNIVYIDKESLEFDDIRNYLDLNEYVEGKILGKAGKVYVFIDEIQDISQWERTVSSWSGKAERYDITITGSNSTMFSGELSTKLTGRFIELTLYPLSLMEFSQYYMEMGSSESLFNDYLKYGGMPGLSVFGELSQDSAYQFLRSIHDSIVLKDIVRRKNIRNVKLLDTICDFCYDNVGNPLSANKITSFLKGQRMDVNVQSVINYISHLEEAQLFIAPRRYDIKGKKLLEVGTKLYAMDIGLRNAIIGFKAADISQMIENIVFLELKRRYAEVYVGTIGEYEVDFIAVTNSIPTYFQVTLNCNHPDTLEREVRPLLAIKDNYRKVIISLEKIYGNDCKGVEIISLSDFLTSTQPPRGTRTADSRRQTADPS